MYIKEYVDFWELKKMVWAGANWTMDQIFENNKQEELMQLLEEIFYDEDNPPDITTINDYLWFDWEVIFKELGIPNPYEDYEGDKNEIGKPYNE